MSQTIDLLRARIKTDIIAADDPLEMKVTPHVPQLTVSWFPSDSGIIVSLDFMSLDGDVSVMFRMSKDSAISLAHYLMTAAEKK